MLADMDLNMGGRAAEEVIFGAEEVSGGAQKDLKVRKRRHFRSVMVQ